MTSSPWTSSEMTSEAAAIEAEAYEELFTLKCRSDFPVVGMVKGEAAGTIFRVACTLITVSLTSSWLDGRKIKRLLLFFSHWLSGLVHMVAQMAMSVMVAVCLAKEEARGVIKFFKFLELSSSNMLAVTNLGICINLALIVSMNPWVPWPLHEDLAKSHRTMSRVKSTSSPGLIALFALISITAATTAAPFWKDIAVSGTLFWTRDSSSEAVNDWITVSQFFMEFIIGICMFIVVGFLLIFRHKEVKECAKVHLRIRFYFGLTFIATFSNLALGICGTIYVITDRIWPRLIIVNWLCRHAHIALDTILLYGVLRAPTRDVDERASRTSSDRVTSGENSANQQPKRHAFGSGNNIRKVHSSSSSSMHAPITRL